MKDFRNVLRQVLGSGGSTSTRTTDTKSKLDNSHEQPIRMQKHVSNSKSCSSLFASKIGDKNSNVSIVFAT